MGHHARTSRPSGKGSEPSGPGGPLARPARHVPSQGEPAASRETCENLFVILTIQEVRVCRWQHTHTPGSPHGPGSHSTLQLLPTQWRLQSRQAHGANAHRCPCMLGRWAQGGEGARPPGGRRRPSLQAAGDSARLLCCHSPL